jgi:hypothetical protein
MAVAVAASVVALSAAGPALAQSQTQDVDISPHVLDSPAPQPGPPVDQATEAPPERPRPQGFVLESTLGVMGFLGQFRHVAPPAYWFHGQLGYELTRGFMVFASGDLSFTDTSESQEEANRYVVPLWGLGGGLRGTVYANDRVAVYGQAEAGTLAASVKHDQLAILGFRNAEGPKPSAGARLGIEWYQVDRHLALCVVGGARYAQGFAKVVGSTDLPLMWDAGVSLRYGF